MKLGFLRKAERQLLSSVSERHFATAPQLLHWTDLSRSAVSKGLNGLEAARYVRADRGLWPNIWRMTGSGARVTGRSLPCGRRQPSASVMVHHCHMNEVEILLKKRYPDFHRLEKTDLFERGLNPCRGEHGVVIKNEIVLVLLDDDLMDSKRITWVLSRPHKPDRRYWDFTRENTWCMEAKHIIVVTTDPDQFKKHKRWIERKGLNIDIMFLRHLWS